MNKCELFLETWFEFEYAVTALYFTEASVAFLRGGGARSTASNNAAPSILPKIGGAIAPPLLTPLL